MLKLHLNSAVIKIEFSHIFSSVATMDLLSCVSINMLNYQMWIEGCLTQLSNHDNFNFQQDITPKMPQFLMLMMITKIYFVNCLDLILNHCSLNCWKARRHWRILRVNVFYRFLKIFSGLSSNLPDQGASFVGFLTVAGTFFFSLLVAVKWNYIYSLFFIF